MVITVGYSGASQMASTVGSSAAKTLPKIQATIGHIPQKLKTVNIEPSRRARLEVLRRMATRLIREERVEFKYNRCEELRPYVERLIQLGLERPLDAYTQEMYAWWIMEEDLIDKMHKVILPRFTSSPSLGGPFTSLYKLPLQRHLMRRVPKFPHWERWYRYHVGVIEIDGNPFPPVLALGDVNANHSNTLVNVLLKQALEHEDALKS